MGPMFVTTQHNGIIFCSAVILSDTRLGITPRVLCLWTTPFVDYTQHNGIIFCSAVILSDTRLGITPRVPCLSQPNTMALFSVLSTAVSDTCLGATPRLLRLWTTPTTKAFFSALL